MSSIYRKGQGGYFYYQAYVYDKKTNKKDKRVFYALGTKDKTEALEKKKQLDLEYEKKIKSENSYLNFISRFQLKSTLFIVPTTILITSFIIFNFFIPNQLNNQKNDSIIDDSYKKDKLIMEIVELNNTINRKPILDNENQLSKIKNQVTLASVKNTIPQYKIERVENLSDVFQQKKIYVTLDATTSVEGQRLVCNILKNRFSDYFNILICIYSSDPIGKNLAMGNIANISSEEKKRSWLGLYTFNSVEGAFFDDSPSSYLGFNN
jgi:hypothetical protein